jgi:hypothetical protein
MAGRQMHKLSAEVFESILANLRSDNKDRSAEKRLTPRVGLRAKIDIVPQAFGDQGARPLTIWVRDISLCGLGILSTQFMSEGMVFTAMFDRERQGTLNVEYTVTYCKTLSNHLFSVGAHVNKVTKECGGCAKPGEANAAETAAPAKPASKKPEALVR